MPETLNIAGYGRQQWVHLLQPGWQAYTQRPIEEVCAHQWTTANRKLRQAKKRINDEVWVDVRYESMLKEPSSTIADLFGKLDVPLDDGVVNYVDSLDDNIVNTSTQPGIGKWRRRNPKRVGRVMDMLVPVMEQLGYDRTFGEETAFPNASSTSPESESRSAPNS